MSTSIAIALSASAAANGAAQVSSSGGAPAVWMILVFAGMVPWGIWMYSLDYRKSAKPGNVALGIWAVISIFIAVAITADWSIRPTGVKLPEQHGSTWTGKNN